jgi:hypothetical protein
MTSLRLPGSLFTEPALRSGLHNLVLLLRNLATDFLSRVCLHGNSFSISLPRNGLTCHIIIIIKFTSGAQLDCIKPMFPDFTLLLKDMALVQIHHFNHFSRFISYLFQSVESCYHKYKNRTKSYTFGQRI